MSESIEALDFLLVRTPSLPLEEIRKLNAVSNLVELSGKLLAQVKAFPEILEAISFSNFELSCTFTEWSQDRIALSEKHLLTLYKYIARMSTRSTPFGQFAGVFYGTVSERPSLIRLDGRFKVYRRLSMDYLAAQIPPVLNDKTFRENLKFQPNTSIQEWNDHYRFARYRKINGKRIYQWISLNKNPLLEAVFLVSKQGSTFKKIKTKVCDLGVDLEKVIVYLDNLIENQFLISELELSITGIDYQRFLFRNLNRVIDIGRNFQEEVNSARDISNSYTQEFSNVALITKGLSMQNNVQMVQADKKIVPQNANLNRTPVDIIAKELTELMPFFSMDKSDALKQFAENFTKRYDLMKVPLLEVLDGDLGIGYGDLNEQYKDENPLLKDLGNLINRPFNTDTKKTASKSGFLFRLIH